MDVDRDSKLSVYLSSILSILIATLLGFLDDIFDIRWRHKLPIPIIASIPLLMVYYAEHGNTNVVVPRPLRFLLGKLINLGMFFVFRFPHQFILFQDHCITSTCPCFPRFRQTASTSLLGSTVQKSAKPWSLRFRSFLMTCSTYPGRSDFDCRSIFLEIGQNWTLVVFGVQVWLMVVGSW